jgi:TolB-like protein/class 3 adenylate cyclase
MSEDRRLAAIMFTDIVGYTALMGSDEEQAFKILKINREIHNTVLKRHNGTLIKEMGDGILACFSSNSDAVRCAIEIQQEAISENIKLRIGIHEGEMVFAGDDVLGDGVNVASRLEELAEEGCINISGAVYKDVKNKTGITAEFIEEKTLKNVDEPVKVYRVWCKEGKEEKKEDKLPGKDKSKTVYYLLAGIVIIIIAAIFILYYLPEQRVNQSSIENLAKKPISIAVLPFDNLSGDPDQEMMCDGLTEEIIHYLSTIKVFDKVISRSSVMTFKNSEKTIPEIANLLNVNFILEGSYRQSGDRLRITAQLIDATSDSHLWTEIYERPVGDIFDIQSDIAKKIANNLKVEISSGENAQITRKPTENFEAYNLYLRGRFFWHRRMEEDLNKSIHYFNQSLELDSTYALAYAGLADSYFIMAWWGWYPKNEGFNKGKELALKALSINNDISEAHATLGGIAAWHEWNWEEAEKEIKTAITLNPNNATAFQYYSELLDILGKDNEARDQINIALKLNPNSYTMNDLSAMYYYHNTEYQKANEESKKALEINIYSRTMLRILKSYVKVGFNQEAVEHVKNIVSIDDSINNNDLLDGIYQKSGMTGIITWFINWMLLNEQEGNYNIPSVNYYAASLYAIIGDAQNAIEYLEKGMEIGDNNMPRINNNQDFDLIRTDPRFISLLRKMRL